jgi:hypothetical protein
MSTPLFVSVPWLNKLPINISIELTLLMPLRVISLVAQFLRLDISSELPRFIRSVLLSE